MKYTTFFIRIEKKIENAHIFTFENQCYPSLLYKIRLNIEFTQCIDEVSCTYTFKAKQFFTFSQIGHLL